MGGDSGSGGGDSGSGGFGGGGFDPGLGVPEEHVIDAIVGGAADPYGGYGDYGTGDTGGGGGSTGAGSIPVYVNAPGMFPAAGQTVGSTQRAAEASILGGLPSGRISFGPSDIASMVLANLTLGAAPFFLSKPADLAVSSMLTHVGFDKALGGPFFTLEGNPRRLDVKANVPGGKQYTVLPSLIGSLERGETLREGIRAMEKREAKLEDRPFVQGEGGEFRDRVSKVGEPLVRADAKDARFGLDPLYSSVDEGDYGLAHRLDAMTPIAYSNYGMGEGDIVSSEAQIQSMIEAAKLEASQEEGFTQNQLDNFLDLPIEKKAAEKELQTAADLDTVKQVISDEFEKTKTGLRDLGSLIAKGFGTAARGAGSVIETALTPAVAITQGFGSLMEEGIANAPNLLDAILADLYRAPGDLGKLVKHIISPSDEKEKKQEKAEVGWAPENLNEGNEPVAPKKKRAPSRVARLTSGKPTGRKLTEDEQARQKYRGRLYGGGSSLFSKPGGSRTGFG